MILAKIAECNSGHSPSYGTDSITEKARECFQLHFGLSYEPFFIFNGTAANVLAIQSLVQSYHSVLCAEDSHLNLDECGAPEKSIGCKLITVPSPHGKINVKDLEAKLTRMGDQHANQPKLVSITLPSEVGTVYSKTELKDLREWTREKKLFLHVDGARFIYAAHYLKLSLRELADWIDADAISFGGTKNGLLFGEAVLLKDSKAAENFKYIRKQAMQLPSKMRFVSAQFLALLETDLWKQIADHGHAMANLLAERIKNIDQVQILHPVEANSVFVKFPKSWTKPLKEHTYFYIWDEEQWVARWMMSFDTTPREIDAFVHKLEALAKSGTPSKTEL